MPPSGPDVRPGDRTLARLADRLRAAGSVWAEEEAGLLLGSGRAGEALDELVRRRLSGEPLEVVLGWVEFAGRRLVVGPGVFVPRRRTELLARHAAGALPEGGTALDLCCGAGAVASVLATTVAWLRWRNLIATGRDSDSWTPSKTTPIPPRAMNRVTRKPLNDWPTRPSIPRLSSIIMLPSGDPDTLGRYYAEQRMMLASPDLTMIA